jgi:acyl-CoA reductase-like NAD-dependent aldehyde dehydrogenase
MSEFRLLINGRLVPGDRSSPVLNPATEQAVAQCPRASEAQLNEAVAAAKAAFPAWAALAIDARRTVLMKMADRIDQHRDELARLLTQEQGKPLREATGEVMRAAGFFRYFASLDLPVKVAEDSADRRVELHRRPLGVVAAIIPWNFPVMMVSFKVPPALLAGNTIVLKPSPTTPLATLRIAELVADMAPPGVLNVIADDNDLGTALTAHPDVRKISFTGSTATGKKVMASATDLLKRFTLELGGNDAAIVLDDADPETVAKGLFSGAFANAGQVCLAIKRVYVHDSIYDAVCDALARRADEAVVGDGLEQGTQIGPVQNRMQYEKLKHFLESARRDGTIIAGGTLLDGPGYFIRPTVVRDITDGAELVDQEQFGPVLPLIRYTDPQDALARANASPYGLGGSVWSSSVPRAREIAARMDAGTVWVNRHLDLMPYIPMSGAKHSGIGVEFGEEGLAEYTQLHVLNLPGG